MSYKISIFCYDYLSLNEMHDIGWRCLRYCWLGPPTRKYSRSVRRNNENEGKIQYLILTYILQIITNIKFPSFSDDSESL